MIQHCIYLIQNKLDLKIYIGYTSDFKQRMKSHKKHRTKENGCKLFYEAVEKFGWSNFTKQIIEECSTIEEASEAEKFWIEFFRTNSTKFGFEYGYNQSEGGLSKKFIRDFYERQKKKSITPIKSKRISGFSKNYQKHMKLQKMRAAGYLD